MCPRKHWKFSMSVYFDDSIAGKLLAAQILYFIQNFAKLFILFVNNWFILQTLQYYFRAKIFWMKLQSLVRMKIFRNIVSNLDQLESWKLAKFAFLGSKYLEIVSNSSSRIVLINFLIRSFKADIHNTSMT